MGKQLRNNKSSEIIGFENGCHACVCRLFQVITHHEWPVGMSVHMYMFTTKFVTGKNVVMRQGLNITMHAHTHTHRH